ncbi:hypothetical protein F5Y15DRAFT_298675 [Xylariaceae sp. FL0016]|nr:hypothetical protein F5Y15DRAFT_298675 [Xylariaceae sp. FL0016]
MGALQPATSDCCQQLEPCTSTVCIPSAVLSPIPHLVKAPRELKGDCRSCSSHFDPPVTGLFWTWPPRRSNTRSTAHPFPISHPNHPSHTSPRVVLTLLFCVLFFCITGFLYTNALFFWCLITAGIWPRRLIAIDHHITTALPARPGRYKILITLPSQTMPMP